MCSHYVMDYSHMFQKHDITAIFILSLLFITCNDYFSLYYNYSSIGRFIWSAKVSNAYFSVAILTYATLTLVLHMLTSV